MLKITHLIKCVQQQLSTHNMILLNVSTNNFHESQDNFTLSTITEYPTIKKTGQTFQKQLADSNVLRTTEKAKTFNKICEIIISLKLQRCQRRKDLGMAKSTSCSPAASHLDEDKAGEIETAAKQRSSKQQHKLS